MLKTACLDEDLDVDDGYELMENKLFRHQHPRAVNVIKSPI